MLILFTPVMRSVTHKYIPVIATLTFYSESLREPRSVERAANSQFYFFPRCVHCIPLPLCDVFSQKNENDKVTKIHPTWPNVVDPWARRPALLTFFALSPSFLDSRPEITISAPIYLLYSSAGQMIARQQTWISRQPFSQCVCVYGIVVARL